MSDRPRAVYSPRRLHLRYRAIGLAIAAATVVGGVVAAFTVDQPATVTVPAQRVTRPVGDLVVVFDVGDVDRAVVDAADRAAVAAGAAATVSRTGSLGMRRITRNGAEVHGPPSGWLTPMVYTSLPEGSMGRVIGPDVPALLDPSTVVMNELTAQLTGAQVGDVVDMQAANGSVVPLTITGIRSHAQLGSAELVFTYDVAARLGATADTRVVIYDMPDRAALERALVAEGLTTRTDTKVSRSWDPPDPDSTLSTARTKAVLGEPWYRFRSDGSIEMHPVWEANNLMPERQLLNETIRIRARCHVKVEADLRAALAAVAAAGLASAIDVANANSAGGCYVPRFSRVSGQIGFLSRHTYGMALDTNTVSNCEGCRPVMNCDVVRIFRRHGFAWGGNFRRPDGMHFEWVGERRDMIDYPSTYCRNNSAALTESVHDAGETSGAEVLVAGEGFESPHSHP